MQLNECLFSCLSVEMTGLLHSELESILVAESFEPFCIVFFLSLLVYNMMWVVHDALKSASSIDSASSVRVGVFGEHRPLQMPRCKSACRRWRSAAEVKPHQALTA